MKKTFKGWISKDFMKYGKTLEDLIISISNKRGQEHEWFPDDWPPRRVTITVEDKD